jgi:hypothetical protein
VAWAHYKHPLPDSVYEVYMKYWADVSFKTDLQVVGHAHIEIA